MKIKKTLLAAALGIGMLSTTSAHAVLTIKLAVYDSLSSHSNTADNWKWMSSYSVWEATTNIFLYPENWLENTESTSNTECNDSSSILFCRRPDLAQLDLTIENTSGNLSYIDLTAVTLDGWKFEIPEKWFASNNSYIIPGCSTCNWGLSVTIQDIPATPVPEPETYAMLLAGLGLLSFTAKRRKQSA